MCSPLATAGSHLRAASMVMELTARPANWALRSTMICQPKTEVSLSMAPGSYHQLPVLEFWAISMKRTARWAGSAGHVVQSVGLAQSDGGQGVHVHVRLAGRHHVAVGRLPLW